MAYLSLWPVAQAVFTALNVPALLTLAPGGVHGDTPQGTTYPQVEFELRESRQIGGLGTKPGTKMMPEVELRVHVYSQASGFKESYSVMAKAIELLKDPPAVTGYGSWAIFHDETVPLLDELVAGKKVKELVARFRLYVEEAA